MVFKRRNTKGNQSDGNTSGIWSGIVKTFRPKHGKRSSTIKPNEEDQIERQNAEENRRIPQRIPTSIPVVKSPILSPALRDLSLNLSPPDDEIFIHERTSPRPRYTNPYSHTHGRESSTTLHRLKRSTSAPSIAFFASSSALSLPQSINPSLRPLTRTSRRSSLFSVLSKEEKEKEREMRGGQSPVGDAESVYERGGDGGVPDLTEKVLIMAHRRVFEGTYSSVYKGMYQDQYVAVKAIRTVSHAKGMRRKLHRELNIWWELRHPNILPCLGYVEARGFGDFGAMISPWCDNGNAITYLAKGPNTQRRVEILLDVANGLKYLHSFDPTVVHGDLKPANVLIDKEHTAKLCDFGLVRLVQQDEATTGMTTTTAHTGTARYLAFELVESDGIPTTASDIHALGCIGFEFLYFQPPYSNIFGSQSNAHYKICREIARRTPPAARPDGLDETMARFWDVLESCWNIDEIERPNAREIVEYLEENCHSIADAHIS